MAGLIGLASLPGRFALNTISDRIAPQGLLAACIAAQALGVALLAVAGSLPLLVAYVAVYGLSFGAISPLRASVMAQHFGRRAYGSITGVQGVATWVGAGLGPLAAGWLYDRSGGYALALWLAVGALSLASLAVAITPRLQQGEARLAPT
jgi:MFS family permease